MTTLARGTRVLLRTPHGDTDHGSVRRIFMGLALLELGQGRKPKWFLRSSLWPLDPEPTPVLARQPGMYPDPDQALAFPAIYPREELPSDLARIEAARVYAFPDRPVMPTRDAVFDDRGLVPGLTAQPVPHDGGAALARRHVRAFSPW